jgi:hypothetical protein
MSDLEKQLIRDEALLEAAEAVLILSESVRPDRVDLLKEVSAKIISLMTYP